MPRHEHQEIEPQTPSQEIAGILKGFGEEHGFDSETCDEIASMPFEEALETAYGYLSQAETNLSPDELLSGFLED